MNINDIHIEAATDQAEIYELFADILSRIAMGLCKGDTAGVIKYANAHALGAAFTAEGFRKAIKAAS